MISQFQKFLNSFSIAIEIYDHESSKNDQSELSFALKQIHRLELQFELIKVSQKLGQSLDNVNFFMAVCGKCSAKFTEMMIRSNPPDFLSKNFHITCETIPRIREAGLTVVLIGNIQKVADQLKSDKLIKFFLKMFRHQNFPFGNYPFYYEYRNGGQKIAEHELPVDPRLVHFDEILGSSGQTGHPTRESLPNLRKVALGSACLDIGCNVGLVTRQIARLLSPRWILGVDIDANLVQLARKSQSLLNESVTTIRYACEDWSNLPEDAPVPCEYNLIFWYAGVQEFPLPF